MAEGMTTEHTIRSDKQTQLFSDQIVHFSMIINHNTINFTIALCGLVANAFNIIVFYKQGFHNTMNISFFGLAVSDMCSLLSLLWLGLCVNPLFITADLIIVPYEILHLTAGIPHICFVRITGWITVFVTAERCLCITVPLKIKQIITPKVTMCTIAFIYVGSMLSFVPEYQTSYILWKFYPERNKTLVGMAFTSNRKNMEGLVFLLYSMLGSASFIAVIVFTLVLVIRLKQKSKWRKKVNADKAKSESVSNRDRKTMTMVVMIASVLIACYSPGIIVSMSSFFRPEFSIVGAQFNAFFVAWSFAFIFETVNSSINIFLYYKMSTKFRETFNEVFKFGKKIDK